MCTSVVVIAALELLGGRVVASANDTRVHFGQPEYVPQEYRRPSTHLLGHARRLRNVITTGGVSGLPVYCWSYVDSLMDGFVFRYWLGNVTLTSHGSPGDVFLQIGDCIARRGGDSSVDLVYFGLDGDDPLLGDQVGAMTATPEFRFTPEPAGLVLWSLAALLLLRR